MQTAKRRRTTWAIGASALAHLVVLIAAVLQRPTLPPPSYEPAGPPEAIIPVLLLPRSPPAAAAGAAQPSALRLHRRAQRPDDSPPPVAPLPAAVAPVRPAPISQLPGPAAQTAPAAPGPAAPDLRLALRHGVAGCANRASLTRAEREACDDQLGRGVALAPAMPLAIEPRIRAYYDAVAEAKKPDGAMTPTKAIGRLGMFDGGGHDISGHGPAIGCHVPFGVGKAKKLPSHWLKLGPCFIAPPKGSLTPEADLTPPDQDMNRP